MKRLLLIVLLSITTATLSGCASRTFTIKNEKFQATDICDGTGTIEISTQNGKVQAKAQGRIQTHMIKNGGFSMWCHGLTHQYTGTVKVFGYTFQSDPNDPLKFQVDRDKGYHYISGKGVVTDSDGKVTTLP
jgi:hypothetical protein